MPVRKLANPPSMKHFLTLVLFTTLSLTQAPLQAIDGVPTAVVRSYLMLKNGQSIRYEQDWEQLIAFLNDQKLQTLLTEEDFSHFLNPTTLRQIPPSVRLTLMQWQFQQQLFRLEWLEAESTLFAISSYAETVNDQAFQKWATSRIALIHWLQGDDKYAQIYSGFTNEFAGTEEVWFSLLKKALAKENSPYSRFKGLLATKEIDEGLDFVVLPSGEWISAAALMQQRVVFASDGGKAEAAFEAVNTILPQAEMENLAPYLVVFTDTFEWDLGSIIIPNNAALQATRNWVHRFKIKQTEWQIIEAEQKAQLAKTSSKNFVWPFSMPISIALGVGVLVIIVLSIRRKNGTASETIAEQQELEPIEVAPTAVNSRSTRKRVAEELVAKSTMVEKPNSTEKSTLPPQISIVEAHQKSLQQKNQSQPKSTYEASPKVIADTMLNDHAESKKKMEQANHEAVPRKKTFDSKSSSQKSIVELSIAKKPRIEEKDLKELSQRFIETLDEAKNQADFEQLWEMVDRFIDKEYPNWKELISEGEYNFSDREYKYLSMMMVGIDNDRIAAYAGIQKASLRASRSRIRKKIGIEGEAEPHTWLLEKAKK